MSVFQAYRPLARPLCSFYPGYQVCACIHRSPGLALDVLLCHPLLLRLSGQALPIAAFPVLGLQVCATAPAFHVGARQQTSGSPGLCSKRFADHVPSTVPGGFKLGLGYCTKDSNPTSNLLSGS